MKNISFLPAVILIFLTTSVSGNGVSIPDRMSFAGMELKFTRRVVKILEDEVAAIRKNEKYFQQKVERANLYFPIIERIFKEENCPDDFKFLALQESSLKSDAVSSSKAVGYWQFKVESATEVGIRINRRVDERMNIVASSRGAARYLKKNNSRLDNWIYALLSYNLGPGGVQKKVDKKYLGARKMTIDAGMHWYVIRFLAHKLAYENEVGRSDHPEYKLLEYRCSDLSLKQIAKKSALSEEDLEHYNKWLLKRSVPEGENYVVILPVRKNVPGQLELVCRRLGIEMDEQNPLIVNEEAVKEYKEQKVKEEVVEEEFAAATVAEEPQKESGHNVALLIEHNKLDAVKAKEGDSFRDLAEAGGLSISDFRKFNDLDKYSQPVPGEIYYLEAKRNKGLVPYHVLQKNETLRDVSQQYGVRIGAIKKKNRLSMNETVKTGRVLHLRKKRRKKDPVRYDHEAVKEVAVIEEKDDINIRQKKAEEKPVKEEVKEKKQVSREPDKAFIADKPLSAASGKPDKIDEETAAPIEEQDAKQKDEENVIVHFIDPGETLYSISRRYNVTVDQLKEWNGLTSSSLAAGSELKVYTEKEDMESHTHTVKAGETLFQVSKKYGVSVEDIQEWNNKTTLQVFVGEKLIIKNQN